MSSKEWCTYLLESTDSCQTYVGATVDVDRRLRQHNGELSGGARATANHQWNRICHITGFPTERAALQFEWKWKRLSRRQVGNPLQRRVRALCELFSLDKTTQKAVDYADYVRDLQVVWESHRDALSFVA